MISNEESIKYYAFYLPQFHPIPENDEWWGKGFTEWSNVTKAKKLFHSHNQPQLPADLGFYDLRLDQIRKEQINLAKDHLVDGFIYYHYWFNGKQLLETPEKMFLENKSLDFPFAFCWANETWSRAWDGQEHEILIKQTYSEDDNINHANYLLNFFRDKRYITYKNRPIFLIYRPNDFHILDHFITTLNSKCITNGIPTPCYLGVNTMFSNKNINLDYSIDFQPNKNDFKNSQNSLGHLSSIVQKIIPFKIYNYLKIKVKAHKKIKYNKFIKNIIKKYNSSDFNSIPTVFPTWDNTSRRNTPTIIQNDNPKDYYTWLKEASCYILNKNDLPKMVLLNAWNEWAEGCHLEPDTKNKDIWLILTKKVKEDLIKV